MSPTEREGRTMNVLLERMWGNAVAALDQSRRARIVDLLLVLGVVGLAVAASRIAGEWRGVPRAEVVIDLSPKALPRYTLFSLSRGLFAYALSLSFTLVYGYWAAKDRVAERLLVPLLDILQSIPILGFMPGLVLAMTVMIVSLDQLLWRPAVVWAQRFRVEDSTQTVATSRWSSGRVRSAW